MSSEKCLVLHEAEQDTFKYFSVPFVLLLLHTIFPESVPIFSSKSENKCHLGSDLSK